ncbi:hypothetical protein H5410_011230 [Solanum commersonii]|uniref:Uncharacterized protein n=1 Tax=Solanum commersonii TaxID=4109 RepID=A0A9J6ANS2_SOLCO|nr:hypothetical protein H5410_011230 [Solanum commersonii]
MAQSEIDKFSIEEIPENDEINIPSNGFRADYLHTRYEALLWRYDIEKAKSDYVSDKNDPLKSKGRFTPSHQDDLVHVE